MMRRLCTHATVCLLGSVVLCAAGPNRVAGRVASVVRTDASGRLVRTVVLRPPAVVKAALQQAAPRPDVTQIVSSAAEKYAVDPLLVHSVIQAESNYNAHAISPKGAAGLMQLIPATARRFGANNSFDPQENVEAGVKYLKYLQGLYGDNLTLTLAAYNAGEGAVARFKNDVPPFRETQLYVQKVGRAYDKAKKAAPPQPVMTAEAAEAVPAVETYRPLEMYTDEQGRLCLRTR